MASDNGLAGVEALATRVKQLLWVVLDSVPADLVPWSLMLVRLLHAADTFPQGGLYDSHYAAQAALRYEIFWLPLAARAQRSRTGQVLIPPLDVAMAWLLHRCTAPGSYPADCEALLGRVLDTSPNQAFRFAGAHAYTQCETPGQRQAWASREVWDDAYVRGSGAFDIHSTSNSTAPGSEVPSPRPDSVNTPSPRGGGGGGKGGSWSSRRRAARNGSKAGSETGSAVGKLPAAVAGMGPLATGGSNSSRLQAQFWPPAPRGSRWDLTRQCPLVKSDVYVNTSGGGVIGGSVALLGQGRLAGQLVGRMSELCPLLHSLLRPAYLDPDVLAQAVQRYCRFLMLQGMHPSVPMIPTTDIALMWVAHMAVPAAYRQTCHRLLGRLVLPAPGVLRLDDSCPEFAETRRLYEHHFGEMYDPPLTRPVPLSTPHPLLSTPLAPFLSAFEVVPTGSNDLVLAATYFGTDANGLPSPTITLMQQQQSLGNGSIEYGNGAAGSQFRCGAHALYLAYLMRRGGNRSTRSLIGLMMGQAHRRRASVKYVANKATGFRNFLHLPDSDCHAYWRKLRLRQVDPQSVPSPDAVTPTSGGSQPDLEGEQQQQQQQQQQTDMGYMYGSDDSDVEAEGNEGRRSHNGEDQERHHEAVRQALAQATASAAAAASALPPTGADDVGAVGGRGVLTPMDNSRHASWRNQESGSTPPARGRPSSTGGSLGGGPDAPSPPPPYNAPRGNGMAAAQARPKRIALIVPLPPQASLYSAIHSTTTFVADSSAASVPSSGRETGSGEPYELVSHRRQGSWSSTGYGGTVTSGPATSAEAASEPPAAASQSTTTVDLAAGLRAAAATATEAAAEPFQAWASQRHTPPAPAPAVQQSQEPLTPRSDITLTSDGIMPSPTVRRPSIERRKYDDGTDEWAYNNPYYVDRLLELGPLSPLSPLGQAPPPASAAFLAAKVGGAHAEAATSAPKGEDTVGTVHRTGAQGVLGEMTSPGGALEAANAPHSSPPGRGFSGEKWAVRVTHPESPGGGALADGSTAAPVASFPTNTIHSIAASGDGEGGGGSGGRDGVSHNAGCGFEGAAWAVARPEKSSFAEGGAAGDGDGEGDGASVSGRLRSGSLVDDSGYSAPPGSTYLSCLASREDGDVEVVAAATATEGQPGHGDDGSDVEDIFCTPTAAFAATVANSFTGGRPDKDDDGGGDTAAAATVVISTENDSVPTANASLEPLAVKTPSVAAAAYEGGVGHSGSSADLDSGVGGASATGANGSGGSRAVGQPPSRLARVTIANSRAMPVSATSLSPPPAAVTSAGSSTARYGTINTSRPYGLPPRPAPFAAHATSSPSTPRNASSGGSAATTPRGRAGGAYSPADVSYMGGLGGVASLVTRGEESPVFSKSLRERYTGSSHSPSGPAARRVSVGSSSGAGGTGHGNDGGASECFASPMVSSSGASFVSAVSRSSGGKGSGAATGMSSGGAGGRA